MKYKINNIHLPEKLLFLYEQKSRYKVVYGGRGSAKSQSTALTFLCKAMEECALFLCTRELQKSIGDSVHKLLVDLINKHKFPGFNITQTRISHANGSAFIFKGLRLNPNEIKSLQGVKYCWVEEAEMVSDSSWDALIPTIREPLSEIYITFNPRFKKDPTYERFVLNPPDNTIVQKVNYYDNPWFGSPLREEMEYMKRTNPNKYNNIWLGEPIFMVNGGLFNYNMIENSGKHRFVDIQKDFDIDEYVMFIRDQLDIVVIAVDPAVTSTDESDLTGIVVCGYSKQEDLFYVLEDCSGRYHPKEWGSKIRDLYKKWYANCCVVEVNQGGDLVRSNIMSGNCYDILVKNIRVTFGKRLRAEPIATLYANNKVKHVERVKSSLSKLEEEMIIFTGDSSQKSPDRLDAMVHGLQYLLDIRNKSTTIEEGAQFLEKLHQHATQV